jgi:hypothetical protein
MPPREEIAMVVKRAYLRALDESSLRVGRGARPQECRVTRSPLQISLLLAIWPGKIVESWRAAERTAGFGPTGRARAFDHTRGQTRSRGARDGQREPDASPSRGLLSHPPRFPRSGVRASAQAGLGDALHRRSA